MAAPRPDARDQADIIIWVGLALVAAYFVIRVCF